MPFIKKMRVYINYPESLAHNLVVKTQYLQLRKGLECFNSKDFISILVTVSLIFINCNKNLIFDIIK
jgi:hypothetical protein